MAELSKNNALLQLERARLEGQVCGRSIVCTTGMTAGAYLSWHKAHEHGGIWPRYLPFASCHLLLAWPVASALYSVIPLALRLKNCRRATMPLRVDLLSQQQGERVASLLPMCECYLYRYKYKPRNCTFRR